MKRRDLADLLLLAAIWGSSFLFMRLLAPVFGPVALAFVRVAGAALVLLPLLLWRGEGPAMAARWRALAVLSLTNSALPFLLFNFALLTLPAGLSSVFNAATPLATALIAWLWLGDPLTRWRSAGLVIGLTGVAGLAALRSLAGGGGAAAFRFDSTAALAIAACLAAALMYGHAGNHTRRYLRDVPPMALATGTQIGAALFLALPAALTWPATAPGPGDWAMAMALATLCSGLAYVLYFRLIAHVGPTQAASVTFLVPVFASAWGAMLLGETVGLAMLAGGALIVVGTTLVLGMWPRRRAVPT